METRPIRRNRARRGFTLIEVMMAVVVFGMVIASAVQVMMSTSGAYRASRAERRLEQNLYQALDRVAEELASTGPDLIFPDPIEGAAYDTLDYQHLLLQGNVAVPGPTTRLSFEYESGEVNDGVDNNGNDLVDEGLLVMTRDFGGPGEQRVVLCRGVRELLAGEVFDGDDENGNGLADEPGFHLERNGRVLTIRLTLEGLDPQGRILVRTAETSTRMRN